MSSVSASRCGQFRGIPSFLLVRFHLALVLCQVGKIGVCGVVVRLCVVVIVRKLSDRSPSLFLIKSTF